MKMYEKHECKTGKSANRLYKIGMFAAMNHITVKTLRFYEEQGLLMPAYVDGENGYRYYTMNQMSDIHRITALKQAGFTLEEMKRLKDNNNERISHKKEIRSSGTNCRADPYDCSN